MSLLVYREDLELGLQIARVGYISRYGQDAVIIKKAIDARSTTIL